MQIRVTSHHAHHRAEVCGYDLLAGSRSQSQFPGT
jgi:hypothetical protein